MVIADFKHALKRLGRSPGFVIAVVAMLAIGLGATTAVVRSARETLFPVLSFPQPERLAVFDELQGGAAYIVPHRFAAYRERAVSFASMAAEHVEEMNLVLDGQPYFVNASWVTDEFFPIFGVAPQLGRLFSPEDYSATSEGSAAVVSYRLWAERFSAESQVVGRTILLGGRWRTIVGVLPASFEPPPGFNQLGLYLPMPPIRHAEDPPFVWLKAIARLKPGISLTQAQAELIAIKLTEPANMEEYYKKVLPHLTQLRETYQNDETQLFGVFLGVAGFLYAIACTNAANLMLARTIDRSQELAVRLALGGTRWQIVRLVLAESVLLTTVASVAGAVIAQWAYWAITSMRAGGAKTGGFVLADVPVITIFIALNALAAGLIAVVPAFRIARSSLAETLKSGAGTLGDSRRLRQVRNGFVIMQAALAVILLAGAGLMIQSFYRLQRVNLGFDPGLRYGIFARLQWGTPIEAYLRMSANVQEKLAAVPGVKRVALSSVVPLAASSVGSVRIADRPELGDIRCAPNEVSPDYFATLGLPIRIGRGFDGLRPGDAAVAVINETMAHRYFPNRSPLGLYLDLGDGLKAEIIGIVADVHQVNQREKVVPQYYCPYWLKGKYATYAMSVLLQTAGDPGPGFEAQVRRAMYEAAPELVAVNVWPLAQAARDALRVERYTLVLLQVASVLALTLAATGLFAVMAYSVAQQRREFGLRMALGATEGRVVRLIMRRGLTLAGIGVILGSAGAWALTRFLKSVLFETGSHDPAVHLVVATLLLVVAVFACWLPARSATRVDPMSALRAE